MPDDLTPAENETDLLHALRLRMWESDDPLLGRMFAAEVLRRLGTKADGQSESELVSEVLSSLYYDDLVDKHEDSIRDAVRDIRRVRLSVSGARNQPAHRAADPVELFRGELVHEVDDLVVRGAGLDFVFRRTYRSQAVSVAPLGAGWDHAYNVALRAGETSLRVWTGALREEAYTRHPRYGDAGYTYFVPEDGVHAVVEPLGDPSAPSGYLRREPDGTRFEFLPSDGEDGLYRLVRIADRFGKEILLIYDQARLVRAYVNHPQRWVDFGYDFADRIIRVSDHTGRAWLYAYDDGGDLVAVTTPPTEDHPRGTTTCYEYATATATGPLQHKLLRIIDGAGRLYLETQYGDDPASADFGRVIRQRIGTGEMLFSYEPVDPVFKGDLDVAERPIMRVRVVERHGAETIHVYNALGGLLAREECVMSGGLHRHAVWRFHYDRGGALVATLSPEGFITQHLYGRGYFVRRHGVEDEDRVAEHDALDADTRRGFGNLLATVRRSGRYDPSSLDWSRSVWGDFFPDIYAADPDDIVEKWTYESAYGLRLTASDPRATGSADPLHAESIEYQRLLTRWEYDGPPGDPTRDLGRVIRPAPTGPLGEPGAPIVQEYLEYDAQGRLLAERNTVGTETRYEYFAAGSGAREGFDREVLIDPGGLALRSRHEVDELGRVVRQMLPRAATGPPGAFVVDTAFDAVDRVVSQRRAGGAQIRMRYDDSGQLARQEQDWLDADGAAMGDARVATFCHDEELHPIEETLGGLDRGRHLVTRHVYGRAGERLLTIRPRGTRLAYQYDERLQLVGATRGYGTPDSTTTRTVYDLDGRVVGTVDGRGYRTEQELDAFGRTVAVSDPLGHVYRAAYDKAGNLVTERWFERRAEGTYVLLARTSHFYDELSRRVRSTRNLFEEPLPASAPARDFADEPGPGRVVSSLAYYDAAGRLVATVDPLARRSTFVYDAAGRVSEEIDAAGNRVAYTRDEHGNAVRVDSYELVRDPDSDAVVGQEVFTNVFEYDLLDRKSRVIDSLGNATTYRHDSLDQLVEVIDPLGNATRFEYDVYGRQVAEFRQRTATGLGGGPALAPAITRYQHDGNGNVVARTDAEGRTTWQHHDPCDRLVEVKRPDGATFQIRYDRDDHVIYRRAEHGIVHSVHVDALGREVRTDVDLSELDAGLIIEGPTSRAMAYDGRGRRILAEAGSIAVGFRFDSLDRAVGERVAHEALLPVAYAIERHFDDAGQVIGMTYPSGRQLVLERDALGRLRGIGENGLGSDYPGASRLPADDLVRLHYRGRRRGGFAYTNGTTSVYQYDRSGRPIESRHRIGVTDVVFQQVHDGAGNIRRRVTSTQAGAAGEVLAYDSLGQLTRAAVDPRPSFDPLPLGPANLPSPSLEGQPALDALAGGLELPAGDETWTYDRVGNRVTERRGAATVGYQTNAVDQYTAVDATVRSHDRGGNLVADGTFRYRFDAWSRLTSVIDAETSAVRARYEYDALGRRVVAEHDAVVRQLVYDGVQLVAEYAAGLPRAQYVHEDALDQVVHVAVGGTDQFIHRDLDDSVRVTTGADGNIVASARYGPFGEIVEAAGSNAMMLGWNGRPRDPVTGHYDFRAREYEVATGRFLQRDPAGFVDGSNLYLFAGNNPLRYGDPLGWARAERSHPLRWQPLEIRELPEPDPLNDTIREIVLQNRDRVVTLTGRRRFDDPGPLPYATAQELRYSPTGVRVAPPGTRLPPRASYRNWKAKELATQGKVEAAEILEAGHACAFCHIMKEHDHILTDEEIDLEGFDRWARTMGGTRAVAQAFTPTGPPGRPLPGGKPNPSTVPAGGIRGMVDEEYYIQNGVRRSVAAREAGLTDVPATIYRPGKAPEAARVSLGRLYSPRPEIPLDFRFLRIRPPIHTPIEVEPLGLPGQMPTTPVKKVKLR